MSITPNWIELFVQNLVGQMHHGHACTHDQNSKPEHFLRDVIVMMNKDVLYCTNVGNIIDALIVNKSSQLPNFLV